MFVFDNVRVERLRQSGNPEDAFLPEHADVDVAPAIAIDVAQPTESSTHVSAVLNPHPLLDDRASLPRPQRRPALLKKDRLPVLGAGEEVVVAVAVDIDRAKPAPNLRS